ncbi:MAG: hypothetical protein HWQ35_16970 [Nostoc sp. NMS1]|nr:hypothetical protein [Nostoc sp. NMS1]MBN3994133.1 hypothetical protein [Nostoc sp. NMS2]
MRWSYCSDDLANGGRIAPEDAYKQIKALWKQLKRSKKRLFIDDDSPDKS